jgi:peptidoglycan/xylan/chitin deacetylase (PgdA/CDA1 family)
MATRRPACLVAVCLSAVLVGLGCDAGGAGQRPPSATGAGTWSVAAAAAPRAPEPSSASAGGAAAPPSGSTREPFVATAASATSVSSVRVPILYLHRVEAPPPGFKSWSTTRQRQFITYDLIPAAFKAQLDWLVAHHYTAILPRDLAAHWDHGKPLPARPVIITFDDGSHDWTSTVVPLLGAHHMVAEFYLTLDAIRSGSITWAEVRRIARAGNGIGAHDVHHFQLTRLGAGRAPASTAVMWAEVSGARRIIGSKLGIPPDSMAYVGGGFDATLERLVHKAGYTTARTIVRGIMQSEDGRFELRAVRIGPRDDVADLMTGRLVAGLPTFAARMRGVSDIPAGR